MRLKLGYVSSGDGIDATAIAWGPDGFISRPNDQDGTKAARAFYLRDANRKYVLSVSDNRYSLQVGDLLPGDRAIVTNGEARFLMKQASDAISLYTVNQKTDQSMMVSLDGQAGELNLLNGKAYITSGIDAQNKAYIAIGVAGGACITLYEDGECKVDGARLNCKTAGGNLGLIPPDVAPVAPAQSILYGPSGMAGVPSVNWTIFP